MAEKEQVYNGRAHYSDQLPPTFTEMSVSAPEQQQLESQQYLNNNQAWKNPADGFGRRTFVRLAGQQKQVQASVTVLLRPDLDPRW